MKNGGSQTGRWKWRESCIAAALAHAMEGGWGQEWNWGLTMKVNLNGANGGPVALIYCSDLQHLFPFLGDCVMIRRLYSSNVRHHSTQSSCTPSNQINVHFNFLYQSSRLTKETYSLHVHFHQEIDQGWMHTLEYKGVFCMAVYLDLWTCGVTWMWGYEQNHFISS